MRKKILKLAGIVLESVIETAGSKKSMQLCWAALSTLMAVAAFSEPTQAQQVLCASFAIGSVPLMLAPDFVSS